MAVRVRQGAASLGGLRLVMASYGRFRQVRYGRLRHVWASYGRFWKLGLVRVWQLWRVTAVEFWQVKACLGHAGFG